MMQFVLVVSVAERQPGSGGAPEKVFEARSIPGNLIGVGRTPQEALEKVYDLVRWTRDEVGSFVDWYRQSWSYADPGDEDTFGRFVTELSRGRAKSRQINEDAAGVVACCT